MRASLESDRRRAGFGLGVMAGTFLAFLSAIWVLPAVGVPVGFVVLGLVVGAPVFLILFRSLGAFRALLLAAATAVAAALIFAMLAIGACVVTGCVG